MERYRTKNGFTLIEVLVSGTILVIAMALISIFFVKASKMRSAVSKENNTQVITSQMMDAAMFGIVQSSDGLMYATKIEDIDTNPSSLWITFSTNGSNYVRLKIGLDYDGTTNTLYQQTASGVLPTPAQWESAITTLSPSIPTRNLDPNDKINVKSGSWFGCYDSQDRNVFTVYPTSGDPANIELRRAATSRIEICLVVTDKNLPDALPFTLKNSVTLRNIPYID